MNRAEPTLSIFVCVQVGSAVSLASLGALVCVLYANHRHEQSLRTQLSRTSPPDSPLAAPSYNPP